MTSDDPYNNKPKLISEPNQWHELGFQISVDVPVNWDKFDLKKWGQTVARFTSLMMAETVEHPDKPVELIRTMLMELKVDRLHFVTDDGLHEMIDKFEE